MIGLGLDPATGAALISFGSGLLASMFAPTENSILEAAARTGNVVAWWRLKAIAGDGLPYYAPEWNVTVQALTAAEQAGLAAAMGPAALNSESPYSGGLSARAILAKFERDGIGAQLAAVSTATLSSAPGVTGQGGGVTQAGMGWLLGGGLLVAVLLGRK